VKKLLFAVTCVVLVACQRSPRQVADKVMIDFGIKDKPEGYVSGADQVYQQLEGIGAGELKRLNLEQRQGTIKFQDDGLRGMYYKEVKIYEQAYPLEAAPVSRGPEGTRGYNAYIDYSYRIYQSARKPTRAEALAESADIPTDIEGRETYRYTFSGGGTWDGNKGQRTRR